MKYKFFYIDYPSKCIFRLLRKIAKSSYYLRYVCPSVRMEHLGSYWSDFHDFYIWVFFEKETNFRGSSNSI